MLCAKQQIVNLKCMNYAEKVLTLYVTDPLHNTGSYLLVQFTNDFFPSRGRLKEKLPHNTLPNVRRQSQV